MIENSNDSSHFDKNQLTNIIKQTFLQLDEQLADLIDDQSGSVCVKISSNEIFIYLFIYLKMFRSYL